MHPRFKHSALFYVVLIPFHSAVSNIYRKRSLVSFLPLLKVKGFTSRSGCFHSFIAFGETTLDSHLPSLHINVCSLPASQWPTQNYIRNLQIFLSKPGLPLSTSLLSKSRTGSLVINCLLILISSWLLIRFLTEYSTCFNRCFSCVSSTLGVCTWVLAAGAAEGSEERSGLPHAGSSWPHGRAQLSPSSTLVVPLEKLV